MNNYKFADVSHHKKVLPFQSFADLGHRLAIAKASDSYHMPDKNGQYDIPADRHFDAYFVDNYVGFRSVGLLCAGYHFVRFDMPSGASKDVIIQKNLDYYIQSLEMLPDEYWPEIHVGIIDMEQDGNQLIAAGLSKANVSNMAVKIVEKFNAAFDRLIFYSGSWWTDQWLTNDALAVIASMTTCWEPEYPSGMLAADGHSITPSFQEYIPSVPNGFTPEFTVSADDTIGKLFAHQYTSSGRVPGVNSNIDLNRTEMSKEQLYKFFGQDGAVDPPSNGDHSGLEEDHDLILAELAKINQSLADLEANLASHHIEVMAKLDQEPPTPTDTITLPTITDKNRLPLSYPVGYNNATPPKLIMQFYPSDSATVGERIKIRPGSSVVVFPDAIKVDGGSYYWKIADYDALDYIEGSEANVPSDFSPENDLKALYIQEKFIA